jgi:PAS domain S-box-containing protein
MAVLFILIYPNIKGMDKSAIILISLGALFLLLAALKTSRILKSLKENKAEFNLWKVLFFLILFFFAGYIVSLFLILFGQKEILLILTSFVFCFGGLFVYIVTRVSSITINGLIDKNRSEELNKELKKSLLELEEYKHFFYNTHDFSCIANFNGYFEILNPRWENALGYTKKELLEKPFISFIHHEDMGNTLKELEKSKSGNSSAHFTNRYRKKDGRYLWFDWLSTTDSSSGKIFAVARDITSRIEMENQLEKSETKFRKMVEEIYDGVYTCDVKGNFTYVNSGCVKITGYKETELIGKHFLELIVPEHKKEAAEFYQQQFLERKSETIYSFPIVTKSGKKNGWNKLYRCCQRKTGWMDFNA